MADWVAQGGLLLGAIGLITIGSFVSGGRWLRQALALGGALLLIDAALNHRGAAGMALAALLMLVNLFAIMRLTARGNGLDADARELHRRHLPTLSAGQVRLLIDQGSFADARAGDVLTREGLPVESLSYLASGLAAVQVGQAIVGRIAPGDLVGEASLIPGGAASATVSMVETGRLWFIPRDRLTAFLSAQPEIARALNAATVAALRDKLSAANRAKADVEA